MSIKSNGQSLTNKPHHGPDDSLLAKEIRQVKGFESIQQEVFLNLERTSNVILQAFHKWMSKYDLTPTQYNALRILRGSHPGSLPCGEVKQRMVTQDTDITRLLDRLEKRNLVNRERDSSDRRVVNATITNEGLQLLASLDEPVREWHDARLGKLHPEQLKQLSMLLERARASFQDADAE